MYSSYIKIFSQRRFIDIWSDTAKIRNLKYYHAEQTFNGTKSNNGIVRRSLRLYEIKY